MEYGLNNLFVYPEEYYIREKEFLYPNTMLGILDVLKKYRTKERKTVKVISDHCF